MKGMRARLTVLWIFVMLNYLYCDVVGLMDSAVLRQFLAGHVNGLVMGQGFLLGASVLMEVPMAMIVVSWLAGRRVSRWVNLVAGGVMTLVQLATLLVAPPTAYLFFSVIEIGCTALIVRCAWTWRVTPTAMLVPTP